MSCIMKEPEGGDALARPQRLQVRQKSDRIKMQQVFGQLTQCPQISNHLQIV